MSYPRYFVEPAEPPQPGLYQVVRKPQRSAPMASEEAEREAKRLNDILARLDEEDGPWGGERDELPD